MPDRWPDLMGIRTVAEYLDCSVSQAQNVLSFYSIPAVQLTPRGDRRYRREDLKAMIDQQINQPIKSTKTA